MYLKILIKSISLLNLLKNKTKQNNKTFWLFWWYANKHLGFHILDNSPIFLLEKKNEGIVSLVEFEHAQFSE